MKERMDITEQISSGPQPTEDDLRELARAGFQSVVNLRTADEEDQLLSPDAEGANVRELGMEYVHIPVSSKDIRPEQVDQFRRELPRLPKPVFVHCHSGKRSGALVMMQQAVDHGWSGQEALQKAEQKGFECDVPQLKEFFLAYIDHHRHS